MVWWLYVSMIKGWDCMNSEIERKKKSAIVIWQIKMYGN